MDFTIVIIGHVARAKQCAELQRETGGFLFLDDGTLGEWTNHQRALEWAGKQNTSHVIVLQDDAQPARGFRDSVRRAIDQRPNSLVSFYLGSGHLHPDWSKRVSLAIGKMPAMTSWLEADVLLHGVGFCMPTKDVLPMLAAVGHMDHLPTDYRIGYWYEIQGRKVCYTWPSLVDHEDSETVTVHPDGLPRDKPRKAFSVGKFIGARSSGYPI